MEIYVVRSGDNVDSIAAEFGVDVDQIIYDNQLEYPYELAVGQALLINEYERNAVRAISVSGYAYPFISPWVLEQTLPYLSELPIFSYGFTQEGNLLPPSQGDDVWMIREADRFGTLPVLTLTPFGPDGNFNNQLIHSVVNNAEYRERLIQDLLEVMAEKGYQGIDIDFEYILAEDRDEFSAFVRQVAETMRANGYHTSVALAPKTSADQVGLLYQGKDYRALGEAADHVLLMTYEWGYTYYHLSHKYYPTLFGGKFREYLKRKIGIVQTTAPVRGVLYIIHLIYYFFQYSVICFHAITSVMLKQVPYLWGV